MIGDDRYPVTGGHAGPRPQRLVPARKPAQPAWARGAGTPVGRDARPGRHPHPTGPIDAGKRSVLGVLVDAVDYDAAVAKVLHAAAARQPLSLTALAVHGVMTGVHDPMHNARLNAIDVVVPDGQPVRWALNILYGTRLRDWVSGPELVLRVLRRMAERGLPVYLYGATPHTLDRLVVSLGHRFPGLRIAGAEPSKFRTSLPGEEKALAARIRDSGARLVLVGLGCPRQETFVYGMRQHLNLPLMAVGAAFDYHAGRLRPAPGWAQRSGLAWVWRFGQEPRRLWRRYLITNVDYLARLVAQTVHLRRPRPPVPTTQRLESLPM